jgi:hypothetical protein
MVTKRALIAGGVAIIPVPGVDIAADVGCLIELLPKISGRFGLLPEQIEYLDTQTKTLVYSLAMQWVIRCLERF